jgi:nucleotide-binding universal stress UspA family protein
MSIFPTKILLATDGSKEAELASRTAADLAQSTGSELHVLYVWEAANPYVEAVGLAGDEPVTLRLDAGTQAPVRSAGPHDARRTGRKGAGDRRDGGASSPEDG